MSLHTGCFIFQTTCVDQGFLQVLERFQELRPNVTIIHGRIQNVYLDLNMKPPEENPDQLLSPEHSGNTPDDALSDIDRAEKGKTYVIEGDGDDAEAKQDNDVTPGSGEKQEAGEQIEHNEREIDAEVLAVTGEPETQMALVDARDGAATETPDI